MEDDEVGFRKQASLRNGFPPVDEIMYSSLSSTIKSSGFSIKAQEKKNQENGSFFFFFFSFFPEKVLVGLLGLGGNEAG